MSPNRKLPSLLVLPPRKFNLAGAVQSLFVEEETGQQYFAQGTVLGYQYQHPDYCSGDVIVSQPGWVYCVLWIAESDNGSIPPYLGHVHEQDLLPADRNVNNKLIQFPQILPNSQLQQRAQRYRSLLEAISTNTVAVTLHDVNEGFVYLDVFAPIAERLNQPKELLIGQPASFVDQNIAEPRIHYIKRALAHGQVERYSYTYSDSHLWKFNVTVAPIYGSEEVVTIVEDGESWQLGYWNSRVVAEEQ
jgi:hypothetical protein